jgi:hypothetical protein
MKFETFVRRLSSGKYGYRLTRLLNGQASVSFNVNDQRFEFKPK